MLLLSRTAISQDFLVLLKPNASIENLFQEFSFIIPDSTRQLVPSMPIFSLSTNDKVQQDEQLRQIRASNGVELAQFNHKTITSRSLPNDEDLPLQWYLYGTTQFSPEGGPAYIAAANAWQTTVGGTLKNSTKVVIAIVDDGFFPQHQDIQWFENGAEIPNNGLDDDNNGYIDDVSGWNAYNSTGTMNIAYHGLHTAGLAGALGNNEVGISGICQQAELLPICGNSTNEATVIAAYGYAYTLRKQFNESDGSSGAFVVSCNSSFGVDAGQPADFPLWCAMFDSLGSVGILSVGATANANYNVDAIGDIPTACPSPFLVSVTGSNSLDNKVPNAAYGPQTIDLAAPGVGMYSTMPQNQYQAFSGTSTAAPIISGTIGLMYSAACTNFIDYSASNPAAAALWIKNQMLSAGVDTTNDLATKVASQGRINLEKCVEAMSRFECARIFVDPKQPSCRLCDGRLDALFSEGKQPFSFMWNTGDQSSVLENLCAGSYSLTLTDAQGDTASATFQLQNTDELAVESTIFRSCNEDSAGVQITMNSDVNLVNLTWDRGKDKHGFENFDGPGNYQVYLHALDTGCWFVGNYQVEAVPPITLLGNSITGGLPPYFIQGNSGDWIAADTILPNVSQHIMDAAGCEFCYVPSIIYEAEAKAKLEIYPNPTAGKMVIRQQGRNNFNLTVFTLAGQKVVTCQSCSTLDLSPFQNGVYLLAVFDENETSWHKIILEK